VSLLLRLPVMTTATLHTLPVHSGSVFGEELKPVQPDIPALGSRVLCDDHAVCDKASRVPRPTLQYGQAEQIGFFDDFMAGRGRNAGWSSPQRSFDYVAGFPESSKRGWIDPLKCLNEFIADLCRLTPQRRTHAIHRAEQVHQQWYR